MSMEDDDQILDEFEMTDRFPDEENAVDEMIVMDVLGKPSEISKSVNWLLDNHFRSIANEQYERTFCYGGICFVVNVSIDHENGRCTAYVMNEEESMILTFRKIRRKDASNILNRHGTSDESDSAEIAVKSLIRRMTRAVDEANLLEKNAGTAEIDNSIDSCIWTLLNEIK